MAQCNRCQSKDVRWVLMEKSQKKNLLDVAPAADGDIAVIPGPGGRDDFRGVTVWRKEQEKYRAAGTPLFKSHFITCPKSALKDRLKREAKPSPLFEDEGPF